MKKIRFSFIWVIIIALVTALAGCSKADGPEPNDPNDTINNPKTDSVVIEITIVVPSCVTLSGVEMKFWNPALPNGWFGQWYNGDNRFFRYVYKEKAIVTAMIGTNCDFYPCLEGGCNGNPASLYMPGGTQTMVLQKGVNQITLDYALKD